MKEENCVMREIASNAVLARQSDILLCIQIGVGRQLIDYDRKMPATRLVNIDNHKYEGVQVGGEYCNRDSEKKT